jgi:hypothetical protein
MTIEQGSVSGRTATLALLRSSGGLGQRIYPVG